MTKITVDLIDNLMCDETLHSIVKGKPTGFQMLFYVTFAQYQKALEDQSVTGNAPVAESEPESETDFEPGLCPVAEQVAYLTEQVATLAEKLAWATHRIAELGEVSEVHHDRLELLTNITETQTSSITVVTETAQAALQAVCSLAERPVSPGVNTSKDVLQLLSAIAVGLTRATK